MGALRLSVLDQSPIAKGKTPADAVAQTLELAQLCDRLGYTRYWLAEVLLALGQEIFLVAVGWQIYDLTNSALSLGFVGLALARRRRR